MMTHKRVNFYDYCTIKVYDVAVYNSTVYIILVSFSIYVNSKSWKLYNKVIGLLVEL